MIITESNSKLLNLVRNQFEFAQINTIPDTQNNSVVEKPIINNIVENIAQNNQDNSICFKYLENDDLSLTSYERDYLKQYNIHLCCYTIDQTCRLPFVKFLLSVQNDTYVFPNTPLQMQEIYSLKENLILSETKTDGFSDVDNEFLYCKIKESARCWQTKFFIDYLSLNLFILRKLFNCHNVMLIS